MRNAGELIGRAMALRKLRKWCRSVAVCPTATGKLADKSLFMTIEIWNEVDW